MPEYCKEHNELLQKAGLGHVACGNRMIIGEVGRLFFAIYTCHSTNEVFYSGIVDDEAMSLENQITVSHSGREYMIGLYRRRNHATNAVSAKYIDCFDKRRGIQGGWRCADSPTLSPSEALPLDVARRELNYTIVKGEFTTIPEGTALRLEQSDILSSWEEIRQSISQSPANTQVAFCDKGVDPHQFEMDMRAVENHRTTEQELEGLMALRSIELISRRDGSVRFVDTPEMFKSVIDKLKQSKIFLFDLEMRMLVGDNRHKRDQKTCLWGMSDFEDESPTVVDVLAEGMWCLVEELLKPILENPKIIKIAHGASPLDIESLYNDWGITMINFIDSQDLLKILTGRIKLSLVNSVIWAEEESDLAFPGLGEWQRLKGLYQSYDHSLRPDGRVPQGPVDYLGYDVKALIFVSSVALRRIDDNQLTTAITKGRRACSNIKLRPSSVTNSIEFDTVYESLVRYGFACRGQSMTWSRECMECFLALREWRGRAAVKLDISDTSVCADELLLKTAALCNDDHINQLIDSLETIVRPDPR